MGLGGEQELGAGLFGVVVEGVDEFAHGDVGEVTGAPAGGVISLNAWRHSAHRIAPMADHIPPHLIRESFATEQAVYGVILVSGMIVVSGINDSTAWQVFWTVAVTVIVFWLAHVYAGTVAHHGLDHGRLLGIRESFRASLAHSWGLLASALIPSLILLFGATQAVPDDVAIWLALWTGVLVLAVLGYVAFARRGAPWPLRVLGGLTTAAFGLVLMLLKAIIH